MATFLNKQTKKQLTEVRIDHYPLPYDPEVLVCVKSQTMGRMNRFAQAQEKGGQAARSETYRIIADSIVDDSSHEPIWESGEVKDLAEADCRLVSALVKMITKHNGGSDADVEEIEKNLDETE